MLRFIYAADLHRYPELAASMFRGRADQFAIRLGWDVQVCAKGFERDEYDDLNPLYVIWEDAQGRHGGSMRFLPTVGRCMANEHFSGLMSGPITSPLIWECTRFCIASGAGSHVAAALMLGGGQLMRAFAVEHFLGVFDARMVRIYKRIGASPEILGWAGSGRSAIGIGLWHHDETTERLIAKKAGVPAEQALDWLHHSMGDATRHKDLPISA